MRLEVTASSSAGNCLTVWSGDHCLLLEAGISPKKIGHYLSCVDGCLVSHEHNDHAKYVEAFAKCGIDIYASTGTIKALDLKYASALKHNEPIIISGRWTVLPFSTMHDAAEPLGFGIIAPDSDILIFATDTLGLPYVFENANIFAVECNYKLDKLMANISSGDVNASVAKRIVGSHMSLENLILFLKRQNLSCCREIHLLHMSRRNIDKDEAILKVQAATGKPVYA